MKSSNSLEKRKYDTMSHLKDESRRERARKACLLATEQVKKAVEKCVFAGHALIEWKNGYDDFLEMVKRELPEISVRTAQRWMVAARNVIKGIGEPPGVADGHEEIAITEILATADDELGADLRQWKSNWFAFLEQKTVNECIAGVVVDGDEAHRIERAINGATKGGAGGDRKDFSLFTARKLGHVCAHLGHWEGMTEIQRSEITQVVAAAIAGGEQALRRDGKVQWVKFEQGWPEEVCRAALEAIKARLKK